MLPSICSLRSGGALVYTFWLSPETCGPEAADGPAPDGSIPWHSNSSSVRAAEDAIRLALWGVPRNRRCRGTAVIALRAALFVQDCASCGGFGHYLLSCGLSELTKRKSDRNPSHEAQIRPSGAHEAQIRPKPVARNVKTTEGRARNAILANNRRTKRNSDRGRHARNANPTETRRTKCKPGRSTEARGVQGREIVGKAVEAAVERVDHTAGQARSRHSSRRPAPPCATRGARSVASTRRRPRTVLSAAFTPAREGLPSD